MRVREVSQVTTSFCNTNRSQYTERNALENNLDSTKEFQTNEHKDILFLFHTKTNMRQFNFFGLSFFLSFFLCFLFVFCVFWIAGCKATGNKSPIDKDTLSTLMQFVAVTVSSHFAGV